MNHSDTATLEARVMAGRGVLPPHIIGLMRHMANDPVSTESLRRFHQARLDEALARQPARPAADSPFSRFAHSLETDLQR